MQACAFYNGSLAAHGGPQLNCDAKKVQEVFGPRLQQLQKQRLAQQAQALEARPVPVTASAAVPPEPKPEPVLDVGARSSGKTSDFCVSAMSTYLPGLAHSPICGLLLLNPQLVSLLEASGCTKPDWTFYCTPVSPANGETQLLDLGQSFVWMA